MSIICPNCGSKVESGLIKEWTYAGYVVNRFQCDACGIKFNIYYDRKKEAFTVPKRPS
jgi:uncharacterized Zn finger protein